MRKTASFILCALLFVLSLFGCQHKALPTSTPTPSTYSPIPTPTEYDASTISLYPLITQIYPEGYTPYLPPIPPYGEPYIEVIGQVENAYPCRAGFQQFLQIPQELADTIIEMSASSEIVYPQEMNIPFYRVPVTIFPTGVGLDHPDSGKKPLYYWLYATKDGTCLFLEASDSTKRENQRCFRADKLGAEIIAQIESELGYVFWSPRDLPELKKAEVRYLGEDTLVIQTDMGQLARLHEFLISIQAARDVFSGGSFDPADCDCVFTLTLTDMEGQEYVLWWDLIHQTFANDLGHFRYSNSLEEDATTQLLTWLNWELDIAAYDVDTTWHR